MVTTDPRPSITLEDIAVKCGVGKTTVHRALTGKTKGVSEETAARIRATAEAMGYDPNQHESARRLAMRRSDGARHYRTLFLMMPYIYVEEPYFFRIYSAAVQCAAEQRYDVVVGSYYSNLECTRLFPSIVERGEFDGVLGIPPMFVPYFRALPQGESRPLVALMETASGVPSITADDVQAGYAAADHLLGLGHRSIGTFLHSSPDYVDFTRLLRIIGMRMACLKYQCDPDAVIHLIHTSPHGPREERMVAPLWDALRAHPETTALIAMHDPYALQIRELLHGKGILVPRDISLMGFDDTRSLIGETGENLLTSVHLPLEEIGRQAVLHLIHLIENPHTPPAKIEFPSTVMPRATTSLPRNPLTPLRW